MTIEFIDNRNSFFEDVKALGRKNSATLGFMPEGGFEDHEYEDLLSLGFKSISLCLLADNIAITPVENANNMFN